MKLKYQNPVKGDLAFQEVLKVKVLVAQLCPTLCNPMDCSLPGLFIHGISRQYWSELPFSSPGDLSDAEIEPVSPALQADSDSFFTSSTTCCCCCCVTSVVSDSVRPHRRQTTRLPHPWDSPGKNTGVGCHFLLQCKKEKSESEDTQLRKPYFKM